MPKFLFKYKPGKNREPGRLDVSDIEQYCADAGISPKKTVFIFPSGTNHHADPEYGLYNQKSGQGLATLTHHLGDASKGYPTLGLPTTGLADCDDEECYTFVNKAIRDIWRAIGYGMNIMVPVRRHLGDKYFSNFVKREGENTFEPSFWNGVEKDNGIKKRERKIADYYAGTLQYMQVVCEYIDTHPEEFNELEAHAELKLEDAAALWINAINQHKQPFDWYSKEAIDDSLTLLQKIRDGAALINSRESVAKEMLAGFVEGIYAKRNTTNRDPFYLTMQERRDLRPHNPNPNSRPQVNTTTSHLGVGGHGAQRVQVNFLRISPETLQTAVGDDYNIVDANESGIACKKVVARDDATALKYTVYQDRISTNVSARATDKVEVYASMLRVYHSSGLDVPPNIACPATLEDAWTQAVHRVYAPDQRVGILINGRQVGAAAVQAARTANTARTSDSPASTSPASTSPASTSPASTSPSSDTSIPIDTSSPTSSSDFLGGAPVITSTSPSLSSTSGTSVPVDSSASTPPPLTTTTTTSAATSTPVTSSAAASSSASSNPPTTSSTSGSSSLFTSLFGPAKAATETTKPSEKKQPLDADTKLPEPRSNEVVPGQFKRNLS